MDPEGPEWTRIRRPFSRSIRLPWGMGLVCTLISIGWFAAYFIRARAIVEGFGEDKKKECAEKFQSMFMLQVVLAIVTVLACLMSQYPMQWVIMELVGNVVLLMWEKHGLDTVKAWGA